MSKKQRFKEEVIIRVNDGRMSKEEAALTLKLTGRQVHNILKRYQKEGVASLIHGNTHRIPSNKTRAEVVEKIKQLAGEGCKYRGFSVPHLQEMLEEYEGIVIGRSTLDRLLRQEGIRPPSGAKRGIYRKRRKRSAFEGWMVQIDGSLHDWLEGRGPRMVLLGAIDDATGKILYLEFWFTECQAGYLTLFRDIAVNHGLPQCYYHDRHTILQSPKEQTVQDQLDDKIPMSELQRILDSLGIESIAAHSPQAKGRIERLWGTLQQRLVREMRVAGVHTLEAANAFLPGFMQRYNDTFAKEPAGKETAWAPIEADMDLNYYFSVQETRVVGNDHVIHWRSRAFQILRKAGESSLARRKVTVHKTPEGGIYLYDGKQQLSYKELASPPQRPKPGVDSKPAAKAPKPRDPQARRRQCAWLYGSGEAGVTRATAAK